MIDIDYKESDLFSSTSRKSEDLDKGTVSILSDQLITDAQKSLHVFVSESPPIESVNQVETIISALRSNDSDFKKYILSFDLISKIISITDALIFSYHPEEQDTDSISLNFENIYPVFELFDIIILEKTELMTPDTLNFCFDFLNIYFQKNMFPKHLNTIHFLMRCFLDHISDKCIHIFDKIFLEKIKEFITYSQQIHLDVSQIVEKMSQFLPEISQKYQYFFNFMKELIEFSNEKVSFLLISSLKNIVKKNRHFIHSERTWPYESILRFSVDHNYETQAVSFEICSLLRHKEIVNSLLLNPVISDSIRSIISEQNFSDVRVIPIIQALTNFMKLDSLSFTMEYITKKGSELLSPHLVHFVIEGSFKLTVDAGYLLAEVIKKEPMIFIYGISEDLSKIFQFKIGDIKTAILIILDVDENEFLDLLISMLTGLDILCQKCIDHCCIDDRKKICDEFGSSGIFEKIEYLMNNNDNEEIQLLCKKIINCFENGEEEDG